MLNYYDRCYDHDLDGHACSAVDLGGLAAPEAARELISRGLVTRQSPPSG
jgi:tRNA 2-selenouridine synthase